MALHPDTNKDGARRALLSLLSNLGHELQMVNGTVQATAGALVALSEERQREVERHAAAQKQADTFQRYNTRLAAVCESLLGAISKGDPPGKVTRIKKRLEALCASSGGAMANPSSIGRAREMLRDMAKDSAWRTVQFVENGVMREWVVYTGHTIHGQTYHPAQMSRFILNWLLEESVDDDVDDDDD